MTVAAYHVFQLSRKTYGNPFNHAPYALTIYLRGDYDIDYDINEILLYLIDKWD